MSLGSRRHRVGRIALLVDEYPLIVPVNYRLVVLPGRGTGSRFGRGPDGVIERADMYVAFEIDDVDAERREGWSVVVRGTLHHVDPDVADFVSVSILTAGSTTNRDAWMVIEAFQITGRALRDPTPRLGARALVTRAVGRAVRSPSSGSVGEMGYVSERSARDLLDRDLHEVLPVVRRPGLEW